ncbi:uncharacterized protein HMPREF1541_09538 [Cyphellophora europaea CBS 101466]|uniref:RING-type E3 ubiquitin transferase n=1 Tax=Cyphellophora europaea (strain CBS 101466) TaxID=1220924 RepID=W2SAP6_CYPE1|nr:uncharacterized protein HMPREF1541_09538 [Cyphellophora europaea CBS 101466]ETN45705.1 hypothetical protein HMPREF1541_09538 [Cyphellophora europaea CBS 101466]
MRPLRFILLLAFFVALPIFLTCWSLLSSHDASADRFRVGYTEGTSRLRAFFSFSTPSSLFPPSALISLTSDNSTFFLARPAAFGPSLPTKGLSGELWVGRGFGDEAILDEEDLHAAGWELGCSDVPGWREDERKRLERLALAEKPAKRSIDAVEQDSDALTAEESSDSTPSTDDGTDDYLHRPLPDSNPAKPGKLGEPANADATKGKQPTHADIESLQESADIAGKIVLLARGGCGFLEKVKWVQRRGGVALIVGDREKGASLTIMYAKGDTSNVTIPSIFTSWNAAHLLSSMVPAKDQSDVVDAKNDKAQAQGNKPVFTSTTSTAPTSTTTPVDPDDPHGWMQDTLAAIGLADNNWHQEDTRRPPGSGNIQWVLAENWDDDVQGKADAKDDDQTLTRTTTKIAKNAKATATTATAKSKNGNVGADDFVIGVQDWRDTQLLEPKVTTTATGKAAAKDAKVKTDTAVVAKGPQATETVLKGGSITPGSGEYDHSKLDQAGQPRDKVAADGSRRQGASEKQSAGSKTGGWFSWLKSKPKAAPTPQTVKATNTSPAKQPTKKPKEKPEPEALWVTLTPTSVSTSPFFDTLLVLVVSPLVTLTVVYALLLLRSRIRRRRWRAPKSVVERLPVRTYHTMTTSSSTTSSQVASPNQSNAASPLLLPATQEVSGRPRPRSQTTSSVLPPQESSRSMSLSPPSEKPKTTSKRRRYNGRQVECVVCLEEYVDGESRVMSLPCGHEFHADCITPWLVNRRRTCPICKGDVVRSMARGVHDDSGADRDLTSEEVQSRAADTVNEEPSSAIPIPLREEESEDEDVERGQNIDEPLLGGPQTEPPSAWRNILATSLSRLSGETVWRQTPSDRSR